jgi:hypothetical protein
MTKVNMDGWGERGLSKLGIKGWWMVTRDRKSWRKILRDAEP